MMRFYPLKVLIFLTSLMICATSHVFAQQNVSISDVSATPDASSVLDISSTSKGLLIPRVALTATNAASPITLPATSMLVYNTATAGLSPNNVTPGYYYNAGSPAAPNWLRIYAGSTAGAEWKLLGNGGTTAGTNFLGTTDAVDLVFKTNNTEQARILSSGNVGIGTSSPGDKLEVFPTGGKSILLGGGATTGSELKFTNSGVVHFSIYNSGDNNLTFANTSSIYQTNTAGTALMSITGSGNVGIGTASPAYRLDLANGTFGFGNSNVRTESRDNAGLQGDAGAQSGFFETASPTNYPAGASSWWHLIDVRHSNNTNNFALQIAGSFFDQNLYFRKTNNSASTPWSQILTTSGNLAWMTTGNAGTVASTNFIGTTDAIDFVVRTNNTEKMRVLSGGNVGIGTSTPATLFQVAGGHYTTQMRLTLPAAANGAATGESNLHFWVSEPCITWEGAGIGVNVNNAYSGGSGCSGGTPMPRITSGLGQAFIRFETNGGNMRFYTVDNSTALAGIGTRERMSILSNGYVGVGTAAPVYKFQTDGDIYANGGWFRVSGNQGYYFESWGGGWQMVDATWIRAYNSKPILATGGLAGYGNAVFGTPFGGNPRIYANYDNISGGGIAIADDGGFYDYNDGWITSRGSYGIKIKHDSGSSSDLMLLDMYNIGGTLQDRYLGTSNDNWGYVGISGRAWYRMYSYGFTNASKRELKKDIHPVTGKTRDLVLADLDKITPYFYRYKNETTDWNNGTETKYQANFHLGMLLDESPDYIQDNAFSGIDIYAAATLGIVAAKANMEDIKEIKKVIGMAPSTTKDISFFGQIELSVGEAFIPYDESFKNQLNGQKPIVTFSLDQEGTTVYIKEKRTDGLIVKINGEPNQLVNLNYIMMAKVNVQSKENTNETNNLSPEILNGMYVPEANKLKVRNFWEQSEIKRKEEEIRKANEAIKVQEERKNQLGNEKFNKPEKN